jgi:transposase-like protein
MSKPAASLIEAAAQAEAAAPALSFFSEVEEAEKRLAEAGEFTGERLFRDRPGVYAAIVRMAAEGQSISAAARALGVSRNTVCAVRDREGYSVEQDKKELLKDLRRASRLGVEKVIELLPDTKAAKDAAIVAAVMVDKMQLLSGEATARVERVEVRPDQVKAFVDSLPVIEAEVVEEILTGVAAGTAGQKAPALPAPAVASSDIASDVLTTDNSDGCAGRAIARATVAAEDVDAGGDADRGGGGAPSLSAAPVVMNSDKQNFGQRAKTRAAGLGGRSPRQNPCKRTSTPKKGSSKKERISAKKKGGSAC